jgi:uncharacterized repeat protein (TIGR03803 family)
MHINHALFRSALLGSTLAVVTLTSATAATQPRAEWKRMMAATGGHSTALHNSAASGFNTANTPGKYTIVHNFAGGTSDGAGSTAEVTLDKSGNIFGTAGFDGANGGGVIFKIASGGTETLLHSFGGTGDGADPDGALTILSNGDIYGTTQGGGASANGTIYKLAAGGTYTVLHSFATSEGSFIRGRLVQDKKGNFYGTALFGGTPGYGTVFEYSTKGKLTILHAFDATDGEYPEHGLVRDKAGNLYGVTAFGGANDNGTVYKIATDGTFSTLYNFTGGADGGFLYGGLAIDKSGNLYGNTAAGGANGDGSVFKLASGTLTTLYSFKSGTDVGDPEGDVLLVGKNIYSTATSGGDSVCQCGGVYEVTNKGKETVLQKFTTANGDGYAAGLTAVSKKSFYGTTASGGADGNGVVFALTK